ncbi:MAG: hypothetical protein NDJ90_11215, partial [Oligoflexia bacterium]|nr:hypothetical protein [Oligoflexia bacterium]
MHNQKRLLISLLALGSLAIGTSSRLWAAASFDSGFLGAGSTTQPSPTPKPTTQPVKPGTVKALRQGPETMSGSAAETLETIKSLTQLLKTTPVGIARTRLILNRAAAMNLYVRQTLLQSNRLKADQKERSWLNAAIRDATEARSAQHKEADTILRAHSIIGLSQLYLDQPRQARENFLEVLKMNPRAENAGWIGLFLAEDFFEEGKYADAANYYRTYYQKMSQQQREQALYKLAWCYINLHNEKKAEDLFVYLIKSNAGSGIAKDSSRDLAYLITHKRNPGDLIRTTETVFKRVEDRIEFLNHARANLEAQEAVELHSRVVERLLELETNNENKLQLLLANLRVTRKLYASRQHMAAFLKLVDFMNASKIGPTSREFVSVQPVVDNELRFLMKGYVDCFAQRAKTPENITRVELGNSMKRQFGFYIEYFPESKLRPSAVNLWLDVCVDLKDWPCVDRAAELVLNERETLAPYIGRAYLDQLAALEALARSTKEAGVREDLKARRLKRMKEFVLGFEKSPQWIRVARLYTEVLAEKGEHAETISLLDRIYQKEPDPDGFFRLQWARYKATEYAAVLDDKRLKGKPEPRLVELWRESALALAMASRKNKEDDAYRSNIKRFLGLNPDERKADVARQDFMQFLVEKESWNELVSELMALPEAKRESKAFAPAVQRAWQASVEQGRFREATLLSTSKSKRVDREMLNRRITVQLIKGQVPSQDDLNRLSSAQREYILGLLAVAKPAAAVSILKASPPRNRQEKDILALSVRMRAGQWDLFRTPEREKLLGARFPFKVPESTAQLPCEKKINRLPFPTMQMKGKRLAAVTQELIVGTRRVRLSVSKEIAGKELARQLRAVEAARDLEKKVAEVVLASPAPP